MVVFYGMIWEYRFQSPCTQCALETSYWTWINHLVTWASILVFFLIHLVASIPALYPSFAGVLFTELSSVGYWSSIVITSCLLLLPVLAAKALVWESARASNKVSPSNTILPTQSRAQSLASIPSRGESTGRRESRPTSSRSRASLKSRPRSGYAFSQEKGFGEKIMSGSMFSVRELAEPGAE